LRSLRAFSVLVACHERTCGSSKAAAGESNGGEGGIRAERGESRAKPEDGPNRHDRARAREWRRGWDSNPRAGYPTTRFRGAPVTTTSVPLRLRESRRESDPKL